MAVGDNFVNVGASGKLHIYDNGTNGVEFLLECTDPATNSGGLSWSGTVNGTPVGGSFPWGAGGGTRSVASYSVTSSQNVTFSLGSTGTLGFGGGGSITIAVSRGGGGGGGSVPSAPAQPSLSEIGLTAMRLTWNIPSNGGSAIDQMLLRRYPTAALVSGSGTDYPLGPSVTTHKPTDLVVNTSYWWVVFAHNANGYSAKSPARQGTTLNATPSTPSAPSLLSKTSTTINLTLVDPALNGGTAITSREAQLSTDPAFGTADTVMNDLTPSWTGRTRATQYYARWRVTNANGTTAWSPTLSVATPGTAPSAPAGYVAYDVASTSAVISTGTLADNGGQVPTQIRVKISTTASDVGLVQTVIGDEWLPLPVYGLTDNTAYYVAEAAFNTVEGGGWGTYGAWVPFTTKNNVPTHPLNITIEDIFGDQVTVNWDAPSSLLGSTLTDYRVRVARNKQMTTDLREYTSAPGATEADATELTDGITYWAEVYSTSSNGRGSAAAPVMFTTTGGVAPDHEGWSVNVGGTWKELVLSTRETSVYKETTPNVNIGGTWKEGV